MSQAEVIKKLKDDGYRMPKPQGLCTDSYYSMMLKCWNEDPIKRPTFDSLFHYFNDYFINTEPCYKDPGFQFIETKKTFFLFYPSDRF